VLDRYVAALGDSLDGTFLDDNFFPEVRAVRARAVLASGPPFPPPLPL